MTYDRLTAADTAFLRIETPHEPQHVGSLSLVEDGPLRDDGGRVRIDDLRSFVASRLHRVPRLRQRLMFVPFGQGRPIWVDDDRFDIDYHVRLTALPRPGDEHQLRELMGRLQSQALDRSRPLWEMWFVDGLAGDRLGLVIKTHHALGDGIANVDLALALVDLEPDPPDDPPPPAWQPRPAPSPQALLRDSVVDQLARPARLARAATGWVRAPQQAWNQLNDVWRAVANSSAHPQPAPWNVPVTRHRRWVDASVPLELVRTIRAMRPATINDVVLAVCAGALRDFLQHRGADDARTLTAMVPVSRRHDDEHGDTLGNRVSLITVELPVHEPDPVRRLDLVHQQVADQRDSGLVEGAEAVIDLADQLTLVAAPLTRFVTRQIPMNLVITNIPGPPVPLYLRGARILRTHPYVEVVDNEGLTIAVVSYDDQLHFGITADRDVLPDLGLLAEAIEKGFTELLDRAGAEAPTGGTAPAEAAKGDTAPAAAGEGPG